MNKYLSSLNIPEQAFLSPSHTPKVLTSLIRNKFSLSLIVQSVTPAGSDFATNLARPQTAIFALRGTAKMY
jgi:hypothetical protein